jgi:hypothetical protein
MAILTKTGRAAIAAAIAARPLHLAWGTGNPDWDATTGTEDTEDEPESTEATGLIHEIGRRELTSWQFVVPDEEGDISVANVDNPSIIDKFSPSPDNAPTNNLFLRFRFDFGDAATATIREVGIFMGTVTDPELPPGQKYFTPDEIEDPGILLAIEHTPFFNRQPSVRQTFEHVLTI